MPRQNNTWKKPCLDVWHTFRLITVHNSICQKVRVPLSFALHQYIIHRKWGHTNLEQQTFCVRFCKHYIKTQNCLQISFLQISIEWREGGMANRYKLHSKERPCFFFFNVSVSFPTACSTNGIQRHLVFVFSVCFVILCFSTCFSNRQPKPLRRVPWRWRKGRLQPSSCHQGNFWWESKCS